MPSKAILGIKEFIAEMSLLLAKDKHHIQSSKFNKV